MTKEKLEKLLLASFPDAALSIQDMTGTGDHWQVEIASEKFLNLSMIKQHQLVYKALGEHMKQEIHALSLNTSPK